MVATVAAPAARSTAPVVAAAALPAFWASYERHWGGFCGTCLDPMFSALRHPARHTGSLDLTSLPFREAAGRPDGAPVLGFVGRIEPRKNQRAIVAAFARLRRALPEARLELVGPVADEAYARELAADISRLRLDDAVRCTGRVPDVTRYVRRWSLFVSLSADEGQGLAVLEAMALGVPVAARSVAGVEDFLADGHTGWALPDRGIAATASVLKRALEAPEAAAITRRARRMVERRYDWSTMVGAFDRLYRPSR